MNKNITIRPWKINFKAFCFFILVFFSLVTQSQNSKEEQFLADGIAKIEINGNQIFTIKIETGEVNFITVASLVDGEYENNYQIVSQIKDAKLIISLSKNPFRSVNDDKRNAHKVVAASLEIRVPKNLDFTINSDIASVEATGSYNELFIQLSQGYCSIKGSVNKAIINTLDGDISVRSDSGKVEAGSSHGLVTIQKLNPSNIIWKLQSINGNITVVKTD